MTTNTTENSTPEYKQRYERDRERMATSFNLRNDHEKALYEYAKTLNFSAWVKSQLALEMEFKKEE
jgi:hypothetical protein